MKTFFALIDELRESSPPDRASHEQRIRQEFEVERAVFALDMSGFSFSVRRSGIIAHLCQIRRMHLLATPIIRACQGEIVKYEADNILAVFPHPQQAVEAAVAINLAVAAASTGHAHENPLTVAIGIDFGKFLLIPGQDCFGDAVNIAFKLGEDIARPNEILITDTVRKMLDPQTPYQTDEQLLSISGLEVRAHGIRYAVA